ncbi:MAG: hypothetical protein ACI83D_000378, partial [Planctomycetota bacterium]
MIEGTFGLVASKKITHKKHPHISDVWVFLHLRVQPDTLRPRNLFKILA